MPRSGFLFTNTNSFKASFKPLILFNASTQLLNEPCPGRTILSEDLILFKSEVTSIIALFCATSLNDRMNLLQS